jgi:hypothetical protein
VVIFPDNDESGEAHAQQVARSLASAAASVRIAKVPSGKDVGEWIERGATCNEIDRAIEDSVAVRGESVNPDWRSVLITNAHGRAVMELARIDLGMAELDDVARMD